MLENIKKRVNSLSIIYVLAVLTYQILWLVAPVRAFLYNTGLVKISSVLAVLGCIFIAWDFLVDRVFLKSRYAKYLLLILFALALSSLVNIQYGIVQNIKVFIWQAVQMTVVFSLCYRIKEEHYHTYLTIMHTIMSAVFVPAVIVSVYQYFFNISYYILINGGYHRQGFMDGRNFGVFPSIYFASLFVTIMMVITLYMAIKSKSIVLKVLYALEAVLFLVYIVSTRTRSVQVGLFCAVFVFSFVAFKNGLIKSMKLKVLIRNVSCIVLACVCVLLSVGTYKIAEKSLDEIPLYIYNNSIEVGWDDEFFTPDTSTSDEDNGDLDFIVDPDDTSGSSENDSQIELTRPDVDSGNISNHRIEIWTEYLKITFGNVRSALVGFGPGSFMTAVKEMHPESFLVEYIRQNYPDMYKEGLIYDTHNCFISVVVSTGILGALAVGLFIVVCIKKVFGYYITSDRVSSSILLLGLVITVILASAFFDSDLFYKCTDTSVMLWMFSGFILKKLDSELENKCSTVK